MAQPSLTTRLFSLEGRVALVTGGASGIGQAIAVGLAEHGADITVTVNTQPANDTCQQVEQVGRRYLEVHTDLANFKTLTRVVEAIETGLGQIDILVNNAGIVRRSPAITYSDKDWEAVMDVNLTAAWRLCRAVGKGMVAREHGKIINIASLLSIQGGVFAPAYTASKHAVVGLTKALANEWAAYGVNVNALAPGYIETAITEALRRDAHRGRQILERIPSGRWGTPTDLVGAAVFLASDAANYVHGHTLAVDGGWLAR